MHAAPAPTDTAALLADPDRLYSAWRQALAERHHLHGPEAAALLGVPEAALVASATGRGNQRLQGELATLLAPVSGWGRVLVAVRNGLGVVLNILGRAEIAQAPDGRLVLHGESHQVWLGTEGIDRIDLFEEHDAHGHSYSLKWWDAQGQSIGRLFLMSKDGRESALPWLQRHAQPEADRRWLPGPGPLPLVRGVPGALTADGTPWAGGQAAGLWATAAILACDQTAALQLDAWGAGAAARYRGPLKQVAHTPPGAHASDLLCKLHTRPGAAQRVLGTGHGLTLLDADGGGLRLQPLQDDGGQWLDAVRGVHARLSGGLGVPA